MATERLPCVHCAAGRVPVWQEESNEWVHRWWEGSRFSITVCVDKQHNVGKQ